VGTLGGPRVGDAWLAGEDAADDGVSSIGDTTTVGWFGLVWFGGGVDLETLLLTSRMGPWACPWLPS